MNADPAKAIRKSPAPIQIHVRVGAALRVVIGDICSVTARPDEKLRRSDLPVLSGLLHTRGMRGYVLFYRLKVSLGHRIACSQTLAPWMRLKNNEERFGDECNSLRVVDPKFKWTHHR
jgi:hypothetical protein